MSNIESFPSWVYTFFIIPLAYLFKRHMSYTKTVDQHEIKLNYHDKKIEKMCKSSDDLAKEVNQMLGTLKEHLRKNDL